MRAICHQEFITILTLDVINGILSLSDIPLPWETKYTLVTINTHGTFRTYHVCMQRQIKMQLAKLLYIPPSVIGIWYLSLPIK